MAKEKKGIISTQGLSFSYGEGSALSEMTLLIPKGKKTVFLGPNGSGKSTLFLCLNGVNRPDSGKVFFASREVKYDQKSLQDLRSKVVLVFQNPDDQIFSATVEEDVAFGPLNLGLSKDEIEGRVDEALSWAGIEDLRKRPTSDLSFGQRKRVSLAGALAMKPEVLIMDEPTAGLDNEIVHELLELSDELNHKGLTVAMSTHDIETAYEWADTVRALERGRLVYSGSPEGFFSKDSLVHRLGFVQPAPLFLNREMSIIHNRISERPYPKSLVELSEKFHPPKRGSGQIAIHPVPVSNGGKQFSHNKSGVYGALARRLAKDGKLDVHYRFHALEKAVLEARRGKDFSLYTERGLVRFVAGKLSRILGKKSVKILN